MRKTRAKDEIITFKADASLWNLLSGIENRSEFIRGAILTALGSTCPLCRGTGVLTPRQKEHWEVFAEVHPMRECEECHELHLVCAAEDER